LFRRPHGQGKRQREQHRRAKGRGRRYRTLGRTGFKASDISMGGTKNKDSNQEAGSA